MKLRRSIPRKAIDVIHQLVHIALRTPPEVADVFCNWSPHINKVELQVFAKGWDAQRLSSDRTFWGDARNLTELLAIRTQLLADLETISAGGELGPVSKELALLDPFDLQW